MRIAWSRLLGLGVVLAVLAAGASSGHGASLGILLGSRTVTVPIPDGFTLLGRETGVWYEAAQAFAAPGNEAQGMFVPEASLLALYAGGTPDFSRYLQVQTPLAMRDRPVGAAEFGALKERLRAEIAAMHRADADLLPGPGAIGPGAIGEDAAGGDWWLEPDARVEFRAVESLGVVLDEERALAFLQVQTQAAGDGEATGRSLVAGKALTLAGDRVVYLYVYAILRDETSPAFVRETVRSWSRALVRAN